MKLHKMRLRAKNTTTRETNKGQQGKKWDLHKAEGILDAVHSKALSKDDTHECSNPTKKKILDNSWSCCKFRTQNWQVGEEKILVEIKEKK